MPKVELDEFRARVAARIREAAQRKELTLTKLCDNAGLSRAHFWRVLRGKSSPTIDFVARLAQVLAIDPDELTRRPPGQRRRSPR